MRFIGWIFLIIGIFSAFSLPIFGLPGIIIGAILIFLGRKQKTEELLKKLENCVIKQKKQEWKAIMIGQKNLN